MGTPGTPLSSAEVDDGRDAGRARIAVIAVHGVGDQQRGDSATDVANLLLSLPEGRYSSFHGHAVHVPLRPVEIADRSSENRGAPPPPSVPHVAMRMRVAGYKGAGDRATYVTTRLAGQRSDGTAVDVFEMDCANLSRVVNGPLAFFGALYQLVLHVGALGQQAVDDAAHEHQDSRMWRCVSTCTRLPFGCLSFRSSC